MNILVAGMGNILRGDDAFGIRVVEALAEAGGLPAGVQLYEAGIAGIPLAQELMAGFEALILVDAVDRAAAPGTLFVFEPAPSGLASGVDAHCADPSKVLLLARALGVCPPRVWMIGCQPAFVEDAFEGMHPAVASATAAAVEQIRALIAALRAGA
jgi:hydrogenase maturation protease